VHHHYINFRVVNWGGRGISGIGVAVQKENRGILSVIQLTVRRLGEVITISQIHTAEYPTMSSSDGVRAQLHNLRGA